MSMCGRLLLDHGLLASGQTTGENGNLSSSNHSLNFYLTMSKYSPITGKLSYVIMKYLSQMEDRKQMLPNLVFSSFTPSGLNIIATMFFFHQTLVFPRILFSAFFQFILSVILFIAVTSIIITLFVLSFIPPC